MPTTDIWPRWQPPQLLGPADDPADYGGVARYVQPQLIRSSGRFTTGQRSALELVRPERRDVDRAVLEHLWSELLEADITYRGPVAFGGGVQAIDPPSALLRSGGGEGTCIDLAALFAGVCLNAQLETSLVMLQGAREGHVGVAVHLGVTPGSAAGVSGCRQHNALVDVIETPFLLGEDPGLVLIDVTVATAHPGRRTLNAAGESLLRQLNDPAMPSRHLVNVQRAQDRDERMLAPADVCYDALRTTIVTNPDFVPFKAQADARRAVREAAGLVVLRGESGVGKSTLARQLAAGFCDGYGWFLNASDPDSLDASLAEHELRERGRTLDGVDADLIRAMASEGLKRLNNPDARWVVVLDNADAGLRCLGSRLPIPGPGHTVIVTSTASPDDLMWEGRPPLEVPPVPSGQLRIAAETRGVPPALADVLEGRPLLLDFVAKLINSHPDAVPTLIDFREQGLSGSDLIWNSLHRLRPELVDGAELAAWLPPDRIESAVLDVFALPQQELIDCGVLGVPHQDYLSMHRLIGRAVRQTAPPQAVVVRLLRAEPAVASLTRFAARAELELLQAALTDSVDGLALRGLAAIEERFGGPQSAATFARARPLLDAADPGHRAALADCLHAAGRAVNVMGGKSTPEQIEGALANLAEAIRVQEDDIQLAKHQALRALLVQRGAKGLAHGSPELLQVMRQVATEVDASYELRRGVLGDDHPLVDRALFNRAGARVRMVPEDPENRAELLQIIHDVYEETSRFRHGWYGNPSVLTASSVAGLATWAFYAVAYGAVPNPQEVKAEGIHAAVESLAWRVEMNVPVDVEKSAALLVKLGLVEMVQASGSKKEAVKTMGDAMAELGIPLAGLTAHLNDQWPGFMPEDDDPASS